MVYTMIPNPDDILLVIFSILDVRDLLSCRQVCWQFSRIIACDMSLQYKMTLALNGLVEPSPSNMTLDLPGRLAGLRKHEAKLHRVKFSLITTRLLNSAAGHVHWEQIASTSGSIAHVVTKVNGNHMFRVYLPSSLCNGDCWYNWDAPLYRPGITTPPSRSVAVDPLQDLLVVAEAVRDSWNVHIRLLSLGSGGKQPHPSAAVPILQFRTPSMTAGLILPEVVLSTRIFAQYVAIVVAGNEEPEELLVWDWRTGSHCLTAKADTVCPHLALLDDSHLALARTWSSDIHVYCVGSCSVPVHGTGPWEGCILHSKPLCTLSLSGPPFHDTKWGVEKIFSDMASKRTSDATCYRTSFRALPSSAVVVFHLTTGSPDHLKKLLILDSSSLRDVFHAAHQSLLETPPPALPFAQWGSGCLVLGEGHKPGPYLHTAHVKPFGSKFVLLSYPASSPADGPRTGEPASPRVHVVDINRWVAKRSRALSKCEPESDDGSGGSLLQCWETGTDLDPFVEPLPSGSRLPFAVYKGPTITFPNGHWPVETIATQSGFSLMFVDLLNNKPAGFQSWALA
ncbi:hypothetical protein GSI_03998 [Ganoderma sinense ZZ0214-1]|uniref:F-box domain-containing protein n=1 Tax=Ganoderma sinense ZZ0214-1 TaxID=1077348 RepID=A0A2G8SIJ3_9APHY|nr:hypothetical protein GSI_03998 [Ganoderma sinense ZZ0214-1]